MKESNSFVIKVPGSTANLGPGFDSLGLALQMYLTIEVEKSTVWEVIPVSKEMRKFPKDKTHLICKVAIETGQRFGVDISPCTIRLESDIPLARGLGSSAAAIVAGIELANTVGDLQLTNEEKLQIANDVEGHPDNVGASIYGGLIIGSNEKGQLRVVATNEVVFEAVVVIPNEELLTTASREVLPKQVSFQASVQAGAIGNVLVAALLTGDYLLAGEMMKNDRYHQPYRRKLVPLFDEIEDFALTEGAFGVALSGAGPTVICFVEDGQGFKLEDALRTKFPRQTIERLQIDRLGSQVEIFS